MPCAILRPIASTFAPIGTAAITGHASTIAHSIVPASLVCRHASIIADGIGTASSIV